jgi:hypothetical protein
MGRAKQDDTEDDQAEEAVQEQAEAHEAAAEPTSGADREESEESRMGQAPRRGPGATG